MFPRLDVDFHLAPFVDPRDHFGTAQSRVRIGAPHFETPRDFWVRPVRWIDSSSYANLILQPVESADSRLLLANFVFKLTNNSDVLNLPSDWQRDVENNSKKVFSSLARFWHQLENNAHVGWNGRENPCLYLKNDQDQRIYGVWKTFPFAEERTFSTDEFVSWPNAEFHDFLRCQQLAPNSQFRLTQNWHQLNKEEQKNLFFAPPIWNRLPILLKSIFQNEALL